MELFECDICGHVGPCVDFIKLPEGQYVCIICAETG